MAKVFNTPIGSLDAITGSASGRATGGGSGKGRPPGAGGGGGGGGGGEEPTTGNNLSFPVIFAGGTLDLQGEADKPVLTKPYNFNGDDSITEDDQIEFPDGTLAYAFAQKDPGNTWQADSVLTSDTVNVSRIDWGDSLESQNAKVGKPLRIEATLYKDLTDNVIDSEGDLPDTMTGYDMAMLANPSSPDEVQGAGATTYPINGTLDNVLTYESTEATVYSPNVKLVIQPLVGAREDVEADDLLWSEDRWVDGSDTDPTSVGDPISVIFGSEINVGGKVIYGLSQGGWRPKAAGDYRITLYMAPIDEQVVLGSADVFDANPEGGAFPVVSGDYNLSYIDVRAVTGGGGGGGKGGGGKNR